MATAASDGVGKKRLKKGRNPQQQVNNNVGEATRIRVSDVLEQFRQSNDEVYTFDANLTNYERAAVHITCRRMGMTSKSSGKGERRQLSVYKTKKASGKEGKENLVSFRFSGEAKSVLQDLFSQYPPMDGEMSQNKVGESFRRTDKVRVDFFSKPAMTKSEIAKEVESLVSRMAKAPYLRQITEERSKLPIASFRDVITSTVDSHQVVLVSGETGCGKTTQVPQFLLDHLWAKGEACKIVCTQPRRISATSVAERVATERGEDVGDTVGYKGCSLGCKDINDYLLHGKSYIRLENKGGRHSSLVFCTTGILLRVLVSKGGGITRTGASKKMENYVSGITHIIVDEIHQKGSLL